MKRIILAALLLALTIGVHSQSNVVEVEYFFDADLGFGMNSVIPITTPDIDITEMVMAEIPASTPVGYHKLYMRTKDTDGNWSHTTRKHIQIVQSFAESNVVMGEYFIDEDSQFGTAIPFDIDPETVDVQQAFEAQILSTVALGYHKLYGRVKDSNGNWSHTFRKNIQVYLNPDTNVIEIEYFTVADLGFGNNLPIVSIDTPEADGEWTFNVPYPEGEYDFSDVLFVRAKDSNEKWSITTILDETTLSINDNLYKSTTIFPNPFVDDIQISTTLNHEFEKIRVVDLTGKIVFESTSNFNTISLGNLSKGVYILRLVTNKSEANFKIVKK